MLACYYAGQVKVAELPLDTCRMMQALEWEDPAASAPRPEPRRMQPGPSPARRASCAPAHRVLGMGRR